MSYLQTTSQSSFEGRKAFCRMQVGRKTELLASFVFFVGISICHFLYNLLSHFSHNPSSLQLLFVIVIITPSVSMFIGQGQSLDARHAMQAERRAANATVVAAPVAERPLSVPPPPPAPLAGHPVSLFGMATGAASLFIAAPSATVAAATTAALRLPASHHAA